MPPTPASAHQLRAKAARLERAGDLAGALDQYEAALRLAPHDADLLATLAELAGRMAVHEVAAGLWAQVAALRPRDPAAADGQARALRELGRFGEAVDILRDALLDHQADARLWNSLGVTLVQEGRPEAALTFFDEALRLEDGYAVALYNRGGANFDLGRLDAAQADFDQARRKSRKPADTAMIDFAAATLALARGDLAAGWDAYEVRLSRHWPGSTVFEAPGQRWAPASRLAGRRLLAIAGQGLGDEIMFANLVPQALADVGPEGRLTLAVEPRLVTLFQRSFPAAEVTAHATRRDGAHPRRAAAGLREPGSVDFWTPLESLCRKYRRSLEDFPDSEGYLRPEPTRVARWRAWLGEGPPAVGLTWRSGKLFGDRRRLYPPLASWAPVLRTPGVRFVNLQYDDCREDQQALREMAGAEILTPPDLDLRNDIDELAALIVALDQVVAVGNATAALAGACGARLAMIGAPWAWPRLGVDRYPWYPRARALTSAAVGEWEPVMAQAAALLAALASRRSSAAA